MNTPQDPRSFVFIEIEEGGAQDYGPCTAADLNETLHTLCSWMRGDCVQDDTKLLLWAFQAEIGTMTKHRLGWLFCLKREPK